MYGSPTTKYFFMVGREDQELFEEDRKQFHTAVARLKAPIEGKKVMLLSVLGYLEGTRVYVVLLKLRGALGVDVLYPTISTYFCKGLIASLMILSS